MKQLVLLLAALAALFGDPIPKGDRDFAMSNLHASRKRFIDSISGLTEAQWKFKPAPDRWSIAECAEHITVSEDSLLQLVTKKILNSDPVARETPPSRDQDEALLRRLRDRSNKGNAPEFLQPAGRWPNREALIEDFKQRRDRAVAFVEGTQDDLRGHATPHPVFKSMDAYQWILLVSGHTERHTAQIEEVKSAPGYPKN